MENIKQIMDLFDNAEKWSAYIELSNYRESLVEYLKSTLCQEIQALANYKLRNTGWIFESDRSNCYIEMYPEASKLIAVAIEWKYWNEPWCRRGVGIWVNDDETDSRKVYEKLKELRHSLTLDGFEDNLEKHGWYPFTKHGWYPFTKQIPASVFGVTDKVESVEECLYMASVNPKQLSRNIWHNVFEPFATKEYSELFASVVK